MMIKPGKSPVFDTPEAYDLEYEDVTFQADDGVTLSGWLLKSGTDKVIIQSHFGVQCSRSGFTVEGKGLMEKSLWNKDIHFLKQAKYLVEAGYSVLMYDMRNHGESENKGWITWGKNERKDVLAAIQFISKHVDYKDAGIGLLSICMGQGASTFAFGLETEMKNFENLKTMISIQPLTYDYFVANMGLPMFLVNAGSNYSKNKRDTDLTGDSFLPYVKDISVPTLVIQNNNDPMTDLNMVKEYYESLTVEKEIMWLDLEKKRAAAYDWLGKNPEPVLNWFDKYLK
ncbi:alpha/beta hydrolase [Flagellimonas sp.]|uniref:alpha/beta hydrolase n=1 Tax=Flagellimonas sp. TaxID=2058762 RepID=UPI003F49E6AD